MNFTERLAARFGFVRQTSPAVPRGAAPHRNARAFDGNQINRLTAGWTATSVSIDHDLQGNVDGLRNRARDLKKNDDYVKFYSRLCRNNIVGPNGFNLQWRVYDDVTGQRPDSLANATIERAFAKWSRVCDVSRRFKSFPQLCRGVVDNLAIDGEALVYLVRGEQAGNPFNFALQVFDVARLDTMHNVPRSNGQNAIIMGVEVDGFQRPVAYHLWEQPPGGVYGPGKRRRVPADDLLHLYIPEFAEQTRGLPWIHTAMVRLHHLKGYQEAAVIAARWGASKMGMYTQGEAGPSPLADDTDAEGNLLSTAEPGEFSVMPTGYTFSTFDPTYPHEQYPEFVTAALRGIASGLGVSHHSLTNDLTGVSFSSIRSGVLQERDLWMELQDDIINMLAFPVISEWLKFALLFGQCLMPNGSALPIAKFDKFNNYAVGGRRWSWVDPKKDMEAAVMAIKEKITSPQLVAANNGTDLEDVIADIARANQMAIDAQLAPYVGAQAEPAVAGKMTDPADPSDPNEPSE